MNSIKLYRFEFVNRGCAFLAETTIDRIAASVVYGEN